ncbi:dihydrodipicolinate synthase family protein [Mixta mediterraneensis]|uniref:dihydrodipicolinate synthase family protein n=1 Tax=Mixta mediterraneensis TaxID=2758443 RepID=UPI001876ECC9|nr:dihydrodipicolinate synthase family protein [Mixta mediterraneensis]MBE5252472.1 dihydrodipicolinate synthase family protein [Mixta mediterraneensis]
MSQHNHTELKAKLRGVLPPITMPFNAQGELVRGGLKQQIDFIIDSGASAIVVGGSTGEGHTLSDEEFRQAMTEAYEANNGRVPFIAGLIVNSTRQAIARVKMLEGMKLDALQVTPVHYLFKPDDDATVRHFREIYEATQTPILIYNVIPWNYLSLSLMKRIMEEVPGVVGMKQSGGDLKSVSDLLLRCPDKIIVSGVDALLYPGFTIGCQGAISALTSAVPSVVAKLFKAVEENDHVPARDIHSRLNDLWNTFPHDNLPACVKYLQSLQGVPLYQPRPPMQPVSEELKQTIKASFDRLMR